LASRERVHLHIEGKKQAKTGISMQNQASQTMFMADRPKNPEGNIPDAQLRLYRQKIF
jgi:hypothetical protein